MAEMKDIVKVAVDAYKGSVEKYSVKQSQELLRKALVEANNGKTYLDYKDIRDGKCVGLFTIVEEILGATIIDGLQGDEFFNSLVEFKNLAEGDKNEFVVEDSNLFVVDDAANGTQAIRRQRLSGSTTVAIPTSMKIVRIYEELNRVLSGRIDFNTLIDRVAQSFKQKMLNDIYTLWSGATANDFGGTTYFPVAGSYDEDTLLDVISHVEAAAGGKVATVIGTKKAIKQLKDSISEQSDGAKEELHNLGYYGKFFGNPVVMTPQRHKVGTTTFVFNDKVLTIIAGDDKPIKFVYEGDPLVLMGNPLDNADLTQEYVYGEKYGLGLVVAGGNSGIGRYQTT